jgi:FSR family fosmidomycin resistance protein-like MFS transporter
VLYATVAEFVAAERHARGFGLFYTLGIGSSACAPLLFGALSDLTSVPTTLTVVATLVTLAVPLTLNLRPSLAGRT